MKTNRKQTSSIASIYPYIVKLVDRRTDQLHEHVIWAPSYNEAVKLTVAYETKSGLESIDVQAFSEGNEVKS